MSRGHTPYGYRIANGIAVVCEEQAAQIRKIYEGYLGGLSLRNAAKEAGITATHSSIKRLLQNPHYLGDDFYPAIIDKETFDAFEVERQRREEALGRDKREKKTVEAIPAPTSFWMAKPAQTFSDPYQQAEYLYSLIEKRG
jgi:hypothetical protein